MTNINQGTFYKIKFKFRYWMKVLQRYSKRWWYAPLIGFLAALDNLVLFIPTEGILASCSMIVPKRWSLYAVNVTIGSTFGGVLLAFFVHHYGADFVLSFMSGLAESSSWQTAMGFFNKFGLIMVFVMTISPIVYQPIIIIASMTDTPLSELALVIFLGRLIKIFAIAYVASHFPGLFKKLFERKRISLENEGNI